MLHKMTLTMNGLDVSLHGSKQYLISYAVEAFMLKFPAITEADDLPYPPKAEDLHLLIEAYELNNQFDFSISRDQDEVSGSLRLAA